jgi:hypothetical protein
MRTTLLLAALLLAACGRPAPDAPASYSAPDGAFTASLPGGWRVDETRRGARRAAFYGPPAKPSQVISVRFEEKGTPEQHVAAALASSSAPSPATPAGPGRDAVGERPVPNAHGGPPREKLRVVALDAPGGGAWVLEHAWPLDEAPSPAFEAFKASFQPGRK